MMSHVPPRRDPPHRQWLPSCEICGEPIGVYEPLLFEHSDGSLVPSALLHLPEPVRRGVERLRLFHAGCHPDAGRP